MQSLPLHFLLAIAAIALIWGFVFFRRTGIVGGCLAAIGTGSCLGHPFFHVSVVTIDRLLLLAVGGLYCVSRNFGDLRAKPMNRVDWTVAAFIGFLMVNVFTSDWQGNGGEAVATLLFFYLMPFVFYWIASRCPHSERSFRWVIGFFVVLGVYLSVTAVFEVLGLSAGVFPRYILSAEYEEFLGRGRGPYLNPVGNGMYLTAGFIAALLWWPYVFPAHRPLLLATVSLIGIGVVCTLTRSVWLGLVASCVGMVALLAPGRQRMRVIFSCALLGVLALAIVGGSLSQFKRDKNVTAADMAQSAKLRPILAAFAFEMWKDNPVTGVGLTQYRRHHLQYLTSRHFDLPMDKAKQYVQHNVVLSLLTETGLVGVVLFLAMMAGWTWCGWQLWHQATLELWQRQCGMLLLLTLAAYLPNAMFHEVSVIPMLNTLIFFVAGLARSQQQVG